MSTDFGAPPADAPQAKKTNTLAIVAVVCGGVGLVLSFCCGVFGVPVDIAAIVCGAIALSQIQRTGEQGRGLAIAGIVMGVLWIILAIVMVILGVAMQGMQGFQPGQIPGIEQPGDDLGDPGELDFDFEMPGPVAPGD